jgi:hypothetical protein
MRRGIIAALATAYMLIGQAWAAPVNVSTAGVLTCPGGCQAGSTLTAFRDAPGGGGNPEGAIFADHYSFVLTGPVDMAGTGYALDFIQTYNIEDLVFELFDSSLSPLGSFAVPNGDGAPFSVPVSFSNLATGAYTLLVSGVIPAAFERGAYMLQVALSEGGVSAVPLPPALWLFVSALFGMFSLTQLRKRSPLG